ncbi:D-alanyl-D-alanine carboxypeptidase family protein [Altererythrobacter epoxidivorans]|nr:D-alanyl-D-alanine carboxypeptidase family protein [Altererythrobacter epoxidivorans]
MAGSASIAVESGPSIERVASVDEVTDAAPIALLVDMRSGQVLYSKEADRRFVPASITKVMSAFVAFEMIESGELDERQVFTFSKEAAKVWKRKGSTMFLTEGEQVPVYALLQGITSVSANDACVVLAEGAAGSLDAWADRMNKAAADLGMSNSHFNTPNGYMDDGKTFTTASDLSKLARALISRHPDKYARYFGKEGLNYKGIAQANHDPITGKVEGADGLKTGFTNEAGYGFLGSAERNGTRLIMVVAGVDRGRERGQAARDLIEWGFAAFDRKLLFSRGLKVADAEVQAGSARSVGLVAAEPIKLAVPKGTTPAVSIRISYEGPLRAPIRQGDKVASLVMDVDGMPQSRIALVAQDDVAEAGPLDRVWNGLAGWFS